MGFDALLIDKNRFASNRSDSQNRYLWIVDNRSERASPMSRCDSDET
jgi:hypothetical protein